MLRVANFAPGFRAHDSGLLWYISQYGCSWTSVVSSNDANYLNFYYEGIGPQATAHRAAGCQVRCLQE